MSDWHNDKIGSIALKLNPTCIYGLSALSILSYLALLPIKLNEGVGLLDSLLNMFCSYLHCLYSILDFLVIFYVI